MAAVVWKHLRAARSASLASRTYGTAAYRAAAMASRSARAPPEAANCTALLGSGMKAPLEICPTRGDVFKKPRGSDLFSTRYFSTRNSTPALDDPFTDDAKIPTDKDFESDKATWALYKRWCKAFNKERDHAEMALRFKLFRFNANYVHKWNTFVPPYPEEAARYLKKRERAKLLILKGKDISHIDECYLPAELGECADGGDPVLTEFSKLRLKKIEEDEMN